MATSDDSDPLDASWEEVDPVNAPPPKRPALTKTQVMNVPPSKAIEAPSTDAAKPLPPPNPQSPAAKPLVSNLVSNGAKVRPAASRRTVLGLGSIRPPSTPPAPLPTLQGGPEVKAVPTAKASPSAASTAQARQEESIATLAARASAPPATEARPPAPANSSSHTVATPLQPAVARVANVAKVKAKGTRMGMGDLTPIAQGLTAKKTEPAAETKTPSPVKQVATKPPAPPVDERVELEDITDVETTTVQPSLPSVIKADVTKADVTRADVANSDGAEPDVADADAPREDEIDEDRAYFAPRVVPKAALPQETEAPKVVINIPGASDEVTTEFDKEAIERLRVREAMARRREPTVRIPRKDVQDVRDKIAAAEREGDASAEIPVYFDANSNLDTSTSQERVASAPAVAVIRHDEMEPTVRGGRSGSKAAVAGILLAGLGVAGAATWYATREPSTPRSDIPTAAATASPAETAAPLASSAASAAPQLPTASATEAPVASSPPLELSAAPSASADPSVVTLNAAAAQSPGHPAPKTWPPAPTTTHPAGTAPTATATPTHAPPYKPPTPRPTAKPAPFKPVVPTEI